jgi:phosphotriesterase-related protein
MKVNTVLGPIETKDMGLTLMHEHILIANHTMRLVYPKWLNRKEFIDYAVKMVKRAKNFGVNTIVDGTPFELGRDLRVMQEVSEKSEVNIIAATGFYWTLQLALADKSAEFLAEILIDDLTEGMEGTTYKASFIKYATGYSELTDYDRKIGKAVVLAHKATGAPIYTHTSNKNGISQVEFFREHGVDLSKVIIGHMGDTDDIEYIKSVVDSGVKIGMDRFATDTVMPEVYLDSKIRAEVVVDLWKGGYLNKMVLSHDASCFIDFQGYPDAGNQWDIYKNHDLETLDFQYTFLSQKIFPLFFKGGMTQEEINVMMIDTPRNIFEQLNTDK